MKFHLVLCVSATPFANATLKAWWRSPQRFEQQPSLLELPAFAGKSHPSKFSPKSSAAFHSIANAMRSSVMMELRGGDDSEVDANSPDKHHGEGKRIKKRRRSSKPKNAEVTVVAGEKNASPENELDPPMTRSNEGAELSTNGVNSDSKAKKKRRRNFMSNILRKSATDSLNIDSERKKSASDGKASTSGTPHQPNASLDDSQEPSDVKRKKKRRRRLGNRTLLIAPHEESELEVADSCESQAYLQDTEIDNAEDNLNKLSAETVTKKRKRRHRKRSPSVESSLPLADRKTTIDSVDIEIDLLHGKDDEVSAEKKRVRKRRKRTAEGDGPQPRGNADVANESDSKVNEKRSTLFDDTSHQIETRSSPTVSSYSAVEEANDEAVSEHFFSNIPVDGRSTGPEESLESKDGVLVDSALEGPGETSKVMEGPGETSQVSESSTEVRVEDMLAEGVTFTLEDEELKSEDLSSETLSHDTIVEDHEKEDFPESTFPTSEVDESLHMLRPSDEDVIDAVSSVDFLRSEEYQSQNEDQDQKENNVGDGEVAQEIPLSSGSDVHRDEPAEEVKIIEAVIEDTSTILVDDDPKECSDYRGEEEQLEVGIDFNNEFKRFEELVGSPDFARTSDAMKADKTTDVAIMEQHLVDENEQPSEGSHENVEEGRYVGPSSVDSATGPSLEATVPESLPAFVDPTDESVNDQKPSFNAEITTISNADELPLHLTLDDNDTESKVAPKDAMKQSVNSEEGVRKRDEESLVLSIVTWNLGEAAPSEKEASFIRKFRRLNASCNSQKRGSDLVMIGAQECEDIKPRRSEGHRSRHLRRLGIQMLGEQYVPIAMHSLGGIQMALYCHRDKLGDVEMVNIADVTCGVGNVFHNKGAIGVYLKMKHLSSGSESAVQSSRILLVTGHLAAHVKNVDARNDDFRRILTELEAQAPARFLRPQKNGDGSVVPGDGSHLLNSMDHVFFSGDLNYRIDLPREYVDRCIDDIKRCHLRESSDIDQCNTAESKKIADLMNKLLRRDQLLQTIASGRAFSQFNEGKISFLPTFKFDKGSPDYDTSYKQRVPAWTDRIVFKSSSIRVIEYDSVPQAMHSDHRPVYGTFQLGWGKVSTKSLTRSKRKQ
ncbi:hypothetical protein HJC23_009126 [Cyclotella cryptica]|uniref:Inositol polyphosphate-related phosphatase domain-containing protein n=1 Tax=Cyclotella cryptica TaxID=29204 RepID=A0ABD3NYE6_9STRA|eukprot:CCRYP_018745-RA/>CCRYP_018745-RA protein AED:0.22 eAED:0.22 QI:0/-1/0/1/-1/1/1/0/1115